MKRGRITAATLAAGWIILGVPLSAGFASAAQATDAKRDPTPPSSPPATPTTDRTDAAVEITVVGGPQELQRLRSIIEPPPAGASTPRWNAVARFEPMEILGAVRHSPLTVVHAWVDLSDRTRARLYFAARSGQRFLVRDVDLPRGFDQAEREALSNVLELSIAALIENERMGLTRAEAQDVLAARQKTEAAVVPRALPTASRQEAVSPPVRAAPLTIPEAPSAERRRQIEVEPSVFYAASAPGGGLPILHGPGLGVTFARRGVRQPAVAAWLSGQYLWPARYTGSSVGVELESVAARAGFELVLPFSASRLGVRLGVGTDVVHVSPRPGARDPGATLTASRWTPALAFVAALCFRRALGSRLLLGAAIFADFLPTAVHYDQSVGGVSSEVITPRRVRPGLMVELGFR